MGNETSLSCCTTDSTMGTEAVMTSSSISHMMGSKDIEDLKKKFMNFVKSSHSPNMMSFFNIINQPQLNKMISKTPNCDFEILRNNFVDYLERKNNERFKEKLIPVHDVLLNYDEGDFSSVEYKRLVDLGQKTIEENKAAYVVFSSWMFKRGKYLGRNGSNPSIFDTLSEDDQLMIEAKICEFLVERIEDIQENIGKNDHLLYAMVTRKMLKKLQTHDCFTFVTPIIVEEYITFDEDYDIVMSDPLKPFSYVSGFGGIMSRLIQSLTLLRIRGVEYVRVLDCNLNLNIKDPLFLGMLIQEKIECMVKVDRRTLDGDPNSILYSRSGRIRVSDIGSMDNSKMALEAELLKGLPKFSYRMKEDIWMSVRHIEKMASKDLRYRLEMRSAQADIFQYKYRMQCATQFSYLHKEMDLFWADTTNLAIVKTSAISSYRLDLFPREQSIRNPTPLKTVTNKDNYKDTSIVRGIKFDKSTIRIGFDDPNETFSHQLGRNSEIIYSNSGRNGPLAKYQPSESDQFLRSLVDGIN